MRILFITLLILNVSAMSVYAKGLLEVNELESSDRFLNIEEKEPLNNLFKAEEEEVKEKESEPEPKAKEETEPERQTINVEATYYTAECEGCIGITSSGVDVNDTIYHEGKRIIATDPTVIPTGTHVIVTTDNGETFEATAQDIGGAIQGHRIDILVETKDEARRLGRVQAQVEVVE